MDSFGEFCFKIRVGRTCETVHINKDLVYSLSRYYRKSKSFSGLQQLIVRITPVQEESQIENCCVVYSLDSEMKEGEVRLLLYGNALKRARPYIRTYGQIMEKLSDNLFSGKSVIEVYNLTLKESGGPLKCTSQSQQPRDQKQVQNCKVLLNSKKKQNKGGAENEQTDEKEEIFKMLHQLWEIDKVHSIIIKKEFFFIITTEETAQDIKQFCCGTNAFVLGVDTTFNLCNMCLTDTCYHNRIIINLKTGNNPNFLGPTLFHFTKDDKTFSRLALELLDNESELMNLKTIGADIEESISKGLLKRGIAKNSLLKRVIPDIKVLYCVRHLTQRDEMIALWKK